MPLSNVMPAESAEKSDCRGWLFLVFHGGLVQPGISFQAVTGREDHLDRH